MTNMTDANHPKMVNVAEAPTNCTKEPANHDPMAKPKTKRKISSFSLFTKIEGLG